MQNILNIAKFIGESRVNGPGTRSVIWLQGCSRKCAGCYNHSFRLQKPANLISVDDLYAMITTRLPIIEGVTFSGGEPFDQAEALSLLANRLKRSGLNILCYSGYTYAELQRRPDHSVAKLLSNTDILIDGPYMEELREVTTWKGSSNQQVHIFNPALKNCFGKGTERVEIIISEEGVITLTGSFHKEYMGELIQD